MNAITNLPALQIDEKELMGVLQTSVYPGAKAESVKLVLAWCRASGKDPMKKPCHIVPMQVSTGRKDSDGWDVKEWRDVIMPGINDYRTDAARTGQHAGTSEPEFGPDVRENLDGVEITYPAWCRVMVRRQIPNGLVVDFSAVERWKENYATKSGKSAAPNAMWRKRPYAQLAKCAEAQALRKAFPEVGALPTADEMEGKEIDMGPAEKAVEGNSGNGGTASGVVIEGSGRPALEAWPQGKLDKQVAKWRESGTKTADDFIATLETRGTLTEEQKQAIRRPASTGEMTAADIEEARAREHREAQDELAGQANK